MSNYKDDLPNPYESTHETVSRWRRNHPTPATEETLEPGAAPDLIPENQPVEVMPDPVMEAHCERAYQDLVSPPPPKGLVEAVQTFEEQWAWETLPGKAETIGPAPSPPAGSPSPTLQDSQSEADMAMAWAYPPPRADGGVALMGQPKPEPFELTVLPQPWPPLSREQVVDLHEALASWRRSRDSGLDTFPADEALLEVLTRLGIGAQKS